MAPRGAWVPDPRFRGGDDEWSFIPRDFDFVLTEIGPDYLGVGAHFGRGPVGDLAAVIEHDHVIRNAHDDAHVVLDEQDPDLLLLANPEQQMVELGGFTRIETGGGLVEAKQRGTGAQRAGDLQPALRTVW